MTKYFIVFLIGLVFCLIVACKEDTLEPEIDWEGNTYFNEYARGKIAFISNLGDGSSALSLMGNDGKKLGNLRPHIYTKSAVWSPKKWKLLCVGDESNYAKSLSYTLFTINYNGANETIISKIDQAVWGTPAWSPDGKKIAFIELADDRSPYRGRIIISDPDGKNQKVITDYIQSINKICWNSFSTKIYFDGSINQSRKSIYTINVNSGYIELIKEGDVYGLSHPATSPNGNYLAYIGSGHLNLVRIKKIYLYNLRTTETERMDSLFFEQSYPSWSEDSESVVFKYNEFNTYGNYNIGKYSLKDKIFTILAEGEIDECNPCIYR